MDKYDLYLLAIPVVMLLGGGTSLHPAIAIHQGLGLASIVASILLVELIFRDPPTIRSAEGYASIAIVVAGWLGTLALYV